MRRIRVIPTLLLSSGGLVKTVRFRKPTYVGDPINALKIFNEKEVDEIIFLDIDAARRRSEPSLARLREIASECFMPLAYGGGIERIEQVEAILKAGAEKVVLNTAAAERPDLVTEAARRFGSQCVVVSVDVKRNLFGKERVYTAGGTRSTGLGPVAFARRAEELGAGEIMVNAIDRDGTFTGYDIPLVREVATAVDIPVVACGGARGVPDLLSAVADGKASAVAAGSMFVFHGPHRAVLISYPAQQQLERELFGRL